LDSAAKPLAIGFGATVISLFLTIAGALMVPGNDDWNILVLLGSAGLLLGVGDLSVGIYRAVRTLERNAARR